MMHKVDKQKRKWLSLGGIVLGASVLPNSVLAMVSTPKPRILTFRNINTGERLSGEFSVHKGFSSAILKKLDHLCAINEQTKFIEWIQIYSTSFITFKEI